MQITVRTLLKSIDILKERWQIDSFSTLFIGGGTPSLLPIPLWCELLKGIEKRTGDFDELSVETNPESLSSDFLHAAAQGGVTRLSLGAQTYNESLLKWLGRPAGEKALRQADELLSKHWKGFLNRDLLAALPSKPDRLEQDIFEALKDDPGHLSLYELTIEPETLLAERLKNKEPFQNEEDRISEWTSALSILEERGYKRYEVSSFARKEQKCLHNLSYWRMHPYAGIGPGAVSTMPGLSGPIRQKEQPNLIEWQKNPVVSAEKNILNEKEFALEHFIMALRLSEGLNRRTFRKIFSIDPFVLIPRTAEKWIDRGMLLVEDGHIRASILGLDILDSILVDIADDIDRNKEKLVEFQDLTHS